MAAPSHSSAKVLFRLAGATASVTFVLILLGGLVWSTGSALACPDWPLCYGQFFPKMEGGILFEHGHRLTVLVVSSLSLAMLVVCLRSRMLRGLIVAEMALIAAQAVLGGLTVILRLPLLVRVLHLAFSQLVFASTLLLAVRAVQLSGASTPRPLANVSVRTRKWLAIAGAAVYTQLLLGALVRHTGSGLACASAFSCDGSLWPSFGPGEIQMFHRYFALLASGLVIFATVRALPELRAAESRWPRVLAIAAHVLILVQVTLGVSTVLSLLSVPVATAHLGTGALLRGDLVLLWAATGAPQPVEAAVETPVLASTVAA